MAAKEIVDKRPGPWVRPVSARQGGSLSAIERCYNGFKEPAVGDVFRASLLGARQHDYQVENVLVDGRRRWVFEKKANFEQLATCVDECAGSIWINGSSSNHGLNDQVPLDQAAGIGETLKFIRISKLIVKIQLEEWNGVEKRRTRGAFALNGERYTFSITDPQVRARYAEHAEGQYEEKDALVCLSLGEPWHGYAYKIIASVITKGV